jgi:cytidine deaminase
MSTDTPETLLAAARDIAERAYAPYSKFRVGAIAVDGDGNQFVGVNVENAAYGSTVCAEASAIVAAATAGVRRLERIAVVGLDSVDCYPCGNCRQILREFEIEEVIVEAADGTARVHTLEELLPRSFGRDVLESGT